MLVASPGSLVKIHEMLGFEYILPKRLQEPGGGGLLEMYKMVFLPESVANHRFFYNGYLWVASVFIRYD